jgi:hypothetical protein
MPLVFVVSNIVEPASVSVKTSSVIGVAFII